MSEARFAVVIEDDADIRGLIAEVLTQAGFAVRTAASGAEGVELVRELEPTVTTLDVSMPGIDGFETARRIRESSTTYLVMITARSEEVDVLQGLQAGADDYVTKPFRPRELRARIDAMLRRPRLSGPDGDAADDWLERPGLRIDPARRTVLVDGEDPGLTRSEFDILLALIEARGRVLSKAALSQAITDDFIRILGSKETSVSVAFEEVDSGVWMEQVFEPEILGKWQTLAKQPGYGPRPD